MESRTIVEWNKDDIDTLGILKVDVLALGMLSCLRRAFELMHVHYRQDIVLADLLAEEDRSRSVQEGAGLCDDHRADTIGVFQIESRAQMSMLPRPQAQGILRSRHRGRHRPARTDPGRIWCIPISSAGWARKRSSYPSKALEAVLERTLGVPLFQEQAMQIAIVGAGFSAGKADQLRRAMAAWKRTGQIASSARSSSPAW